MSKKNLYIAAAGIAVLATVAGIYFKFYSNPVVAKIGQYEIREIDVALRDAINKIYYPKNENSYGLEQLVKAYSSAQIMHNYGRSITEKVIRDEEMRIDRATRNPETLNRIKALFEGDMDAYRRIFILPNLIDRIFQQFFQSDARFHLEHQKEAERLLQMTKQSGLPMKEVARQAKLETALMRVSQSEGVYFWSPEMEKQLNAQVTKLPDGTPKNLTSMFEQGPRGNTGIATIWISEIQQLRKGDIAAQLLELNNEWILAKVQSIESAKLKDSSRREKQFTLEVIRYPKLTFDTWFETEKKSIPISYY